MSRIEFLRNLENKGVDDRHRIELAYIVAKGEHHWQRRDDGKPYFHDHCRGVAEILVNEFGVYNPDLVCAALLHDIVEDTRYVTVTKIDSWFGERVAYLVDLLTKPTGPVHVPYLERLSTDPQAALIKAADNLHNVRGLAGVTEHKRRYQLKRTRTQILPMLRSVMRRCHEDTGPNSYLYAHLEAAERLLQDAVDGYYKPCRQCGVGTDHDDGFCSGTCKSQYEREITGEVDE